MKRDVYKRQIQGSTDITPDMLAELETTLEGMDLGPLLGLWLQSSVIGLTMQIMGIIIFVLVYGRMIEIYLMTSLAPLPVATLSNRELGGTGQNYLKSLFAVGFQGMLILVCVAIYAVLIPVSYTHLTRRIRWTGTTRSIVKSGGMNGRLSRTAIWTPMTARSVWTCVPMPDRGLI